ncbi:MAG: hypothetical protein U0931_29375 [Vulcanimicrobiota bacterium]
MKDCLIMLKPAQGGSRSLAMWLFNNPLTEAQRQQYSQAAQLPEGVLEVSLELDQRASYLSVKRIRGGGFAFRNLKGGFGGGSLPFVYGSTTRPADNFKLNLGGTLEAGSPVHANLTITDDSKMVVVRCKLKCSGPLIVK